MVRHIHKYSENNIRTTEYFKSITVYQLAKTTRVIQNTSPISGITKVTGAELQLLGTSIDYVVLFSYTIESIFVRLKRR